MIAGHFESRWKITRDSINYSDKERRNHCLVRAHSLSIASGMAMAMIDISQLLLVNLVSLVESVFKKVHPKVSRPDFTPGDAVLVRQAQ